jgi:hypothetical protein
MTHERDTERLLDLWFADGPTRASDRVIDVVADRIGRQSQRPGWRLDWRRFAMNTNVKIAAAMAAVLIVAVVGYNLLPGSPAGFGGPGPTASPSATPSPTPTPPALPDGRLTAGDYILRTVEGDPMAFAITAPEGWTGFGGFFVGGPNLSGAPDGVGISVNHDPQVTTDPCDSSVHTPPPGSSGPSVDDLVSAISARRDLAVSGVTDAVLAGHSGKRLDLQFPATLACENHYVFAEPKGLYANGPANRWRVWLLDVDGDTAVVVLLDYAGTPAADRAAAQAIVDSVRITQ